MDFRGASLFRDPADEALVVDLLKGFADLTGISVVILDRDGVPVVNQLGPRNRFCMDLIKGTSQGAAVCRACDVEHGNAAAREKSVQVYTCAHGLVDFVAPIEYEGDVLALVFGGQLIDADCPLSREALDQLASELGLDPDVVALAYAETTAMPRPTIEKSARFLFMVARSISAFISARSEERNLRFRRDRLARILQQDLGQLTFARADPRGVLACLERIAESIMRLLEADLVEIYVTDGLSGGVVGPPARAGRLQAPEPSRYELNDESVVTRILDGGEDLFVEDSASDSLLSAPKPVGKIGYVEREGIASTAAVALRAGGERLGLVFVNYRMARRFRKRDKDMATALAAQVAVAVANARLLERLDEQAAWLAVLKRLGSSLSSLSTKQIARAIHDALRPVVDFSTFFLCTYDEGRDEADFVLWMTDGEERAVDDGIGELTRRVIEGGESLLIRHFSTEKVERGIRDARIATGYQESWLGVPLKVGPRVTGVISIQSPQCYAFDEEVRSNLEALANQVSFLVENSHFLDDARELGLGVMRASFSGEARDAIDDLKAVGERILARLPIGVEYLRATLQVIDGGGRYSIAASGYELDKNNRYMQRALHEDELIRGIVERREPYTIPDTEGHTLWQRTHDTKDVRSWLGLPLVSRDRTVGIVILDHDRPGAYGAVGPELLEYSRHAGALLLNALAAESGRNQLHGMRMLNAIMGTTSLSLDPRTFLEMMSKELLERLECSDSCIYLLRKDERPYVLQAEVANGEHAESARLRIVDLSGPSPAAEAFKRNTTLVYADTVLQVPPRAGVERRSGPRSVIVTALRAGGKRIGVIAAESDRFRWFVDSDRVLFDTLAQQVGMAYERVLGVSLIRRITEHIRQDKEVEVILREIIRGSVEMTCSSSGVIYYLSADGLEVEKSYQYPTLPPLPPPRMGYSRGITRSIIRKRDKEVIPDLKSDPRVRKNLKRTYASMIGLPLLLEDRVVGVLYLNDEVKRDYSTSEMSFLQTLANHAAIVIDKASRNSRQRDAMQRLVSINAWTERFFHKIKQPITSIKADGDDLVREARRRTSDLRKVRSLAILMRDSAKSIMVKVERVADAIEETSRSGHATRSLELSGFVSNIVVEFRIQARWNGGPAVEIVFVPCPETVRVELMEDLMRMAIINVLENAFEACGDRGTVQVSIAALDGRGTATITVADDGCGMSRETIDALFVRPFDTRKEHGMGMGLYSTKLICDASEIGISVKSEEGKGSAFTFVIPIRA